MTQAMKPVAEPPNSAVDFDLDLDFSLDDEPVATVPAPAAKVEQTVAMPALITQPAPFQATAPDPFKMSKGLNFTTGPVLTTDATPLDSAGGMLEFDLSSLSLDLDGPTTEGQKITTSLPELAGSDDPLETKFALAEEFRAIGDVDGARSLAEEVLSQSSGSLKGKAQAFLNALT